MSNITAKTPEKKSNFQPINRSEKKEGTEESILLRVLVQTLVVVGIIAVDIAAETPLEDIPISVWAVPLSIVGAFVSWNRRKKRNIALKFLLAIGMIGAMFYFFRSLFGQIGTSIGSNDTRIILSQLLIQLQVLHSFDLPRRKDLGYSMVIGLILLGVAGTISQTLAFAPILVIFLALGLPILVLDYRSRIGLILTSKNLKKELKVIFPNRQVQKKFGILFLVVLGLGLGIFAIMPRFPSYQLQTFPVNAPNNMQKDKSFRDFNGNDRSVKVPPGYKQGKGTKGNNSDDETGQDDTFYYGFDSKVNQNRKGQPLKPKVLMRVRSQSEGFWRVVALDKYTGQGWEISRENQVTTINRPWWTYRFFLSGSPSVNVRTKNIIQTYSIVSDMQGLIPGLSYPKELYFPTEKIGIDSEGGMRTPGYLPEGLTYTLISEVPYRNETLLGKITEIKYDKTMAEYYLQIPPEIAEKVKKKTEEILEKSPNEITSPYWKAKYLAQYLKQHFTLPEKADGSPLLQENEDLVEAFLLKDQGGYPDHFATTLTIMLRSIGIPARLVGGFSPGQFNPFTGLYIVKNTDAYAMTEVYFGTRYGWFTFDAIPGHPLMPSSIEDDQTFSVLKSFWQLISGLIPAPITSVINAIFAEIYRWIAIGIIWLWSILTNGWIGFFTGILLLITLGFFGWLLWTQLKKLRYSIWLKKLPPMEGLYQEMLGFLAEQGFRKNAAQTPFEYAKSSTNVYSPEVSEIINEICQSYVGWRYGQKDVNLVYLKQRLKLLQKSFGTKFKLQQIVKS